MVNLGLDHKGKERRRKKENKGDKKKQSSFFWNSNEEMLPFLLKLWFSHKFYSNPIQLRQMWDILILYNSCFLETTPKSQFLGDSQCGDRSENRGIPVGERGQRMEKILWKQETLTGLWVGWIGMVRHNSINAFYLKKYPSRKSPWVEWEVKVSPVFWHKLCLLCKFAL